MHLICLCRHSRTFIANGYTDLAEKALLFDGALKESEQQQGIFFENQSPLTRTYMKKS